MANKNFKARIGIEAPLIAADNGTTAITLSDNDVTVVGDLTVTSNTIKSSSATAITLSGADVAIAGDITITGNSIRSSVGGTAIELNDTDITVVGDLQVGGGDIKSNGGTTAITLSGANATVVGDLAVNGGDITTTQTTASVFNTTATTLNIGGAATLAANIGTANGSVVKGPNRFTSPTITAFQGSSSSSRGLSISNGNGSSAAQARNALVLRTYPTSGAARGQVLFENARGTETTPTALQNNDLTGETSASGYATNGWVSDYVVAVPGVAQFIATETWANTGGPYPTAGTVTNAGLGYQIALQPTATTVTASNGSRINVLSINPQTFSQRSDQYFWNKGKTNNASMASLVDDGGGHIVFSVNQTRATTNNDFSLINFATYRSADGVNYTPTQFADFIGAFKFNGNANTSTSPGVAGGPGAQIFAQATENWSASAQGTKFTLSANKTGTTTSYTVFEANPDEIKLSATTIDLNSFDGTTALVGNNINYNRVYGQFQYDTTVTPVAADTAYVFPLGTADINNIATVGSTSRLIPGAAGIYNLQFSVQVDNADNANDHDAYIWLRKNGTDVAGSMGRTTLTKNNAGSLQIIAWNYIVSSANTTDYWEIAYAVSDTDVTFPAFGTTAFGPSTACIITSLTPVGA